MNSCRTKVPVIRVAVNVPEKWIAPLFPRSNEMVSDPTVPLITDHVAISPSTSRHLPWCDAGRGEAARGRRGLQTAGEVDDARAEQRRR